ncbi:MAG: ADP-glyceromanno-heptose 6-epimerase [Candidatus Omnitrophica bacterium]|nr:ADP-glyceromanno-heptose 6-epimerase [Candidatus Omnitrophota bacterium]
MIVVTGAAGFIGSCIVAKLNAAGHEDLILVDNLTEEKKKNLEGKKYQSYIDKKDFLAQIKADHFKTAVEAVIHMGACSSTTLQDAEYFKKNNLQYSQILAQWAIDRNVRFIYASSAATYGDGSIGYKDDVETILKCRPLNLYGKSKQDFDLWILENNFLNQVVGLKFFNVFGPNEYHKKDMRSVVAKAYQRVVEEGVISLFQSNDQRYSDGGQMRDFIYVKDAVDVVLFFLSHPKQNGIFNVGTGVARTWNDLAQALFSAVDKEPVIKYVEMPDTLKEKYQNYTQADTGHLREAGFQSAFTSLEDAVKDYTSYLSTHSYY